MPNFNRLHALHDWIMQNVPPDQFNLDIVWEDGTPWESESDQPCGCAIGWARKVPGFVEAGYVARHYALSWPSAASWFFEVSELEANFLFGGRRAFETPQHKHAWHERVLRFFAKYDEAPHTATPARAAPHTTTPARVAPQHEPEREPALVD